jgi:hypothetical protein
VHVCLCLCARVNLRVSVCVQFFLAGLSNFYPAKKEALMADLRNITFESLLTEQGRVNIDKMLEETVDGDQSEFMEAIRDQYLFEMGEFCDQIFEGFKHSDRAKAGTLTAGQIEAILGEVDPHKPIDDIRYYMKKGLDKNSYSLDEAVDYRKFFKQLKFAVLVARTGHYVPSALPPPAMLY